MRAHLFLGVVATTACTPPPGPAQVRPGMDVLLTDSVHLVRGRRLGLLTNHTGIDRQGRRAVDVLASARGARLVALLSPEHGFHGTEDRPGLPAAVDSVTGLPIYSLYRGSRPPNVAAVDSVDVVLIDLQDSGARYSRMPDLESALHLVQGARLRVTDRAISDPMRVAVALLAALRAVHGDWLRFREVAVDRLAAGPAVRQAVLAGVGATAIWSAWDEPLARFRATRAKYLLY